MPKKMKKPRMIRMRATKEKKEKDKNKIKQSVKINITTSGGGSGGSGIPSIPTPIYNSMQGQKTGENVETNNLLKQLIQKQQPIIQPIYQAPMRQQIFDDEIQPRVLEKDLTDYNGETLLQTVNRDNKIDVLEKANRDDIDEQEDFINAANISNESQSQPQPEQPQQLKGIYIKPNGKFQANYKGTNIKTYDTIEEAQSVLNYIASNYPNDTGATIKKNINAIRQGYEKSLKKSEDL